MENSQLNIEILMFLKVENIAENKITFSNAHLYSRSTFANENPLVCVLSLKKKIQQKMPKIRKKYQNKYIF